MKKLFFGLLILAVLSFTSVLFAADHFNAGTLKVYEDVDQVSIVWTVTLASGSDTVGSWHSKPIYIGDCNANNAYDYCVQDATGDLNVIYHYSPDDKTTWLPTVTPLALDQVSSTVKTDTLGAGTSDEKGFKFARYWVIELDGQTGNASNTITFYATLRKDASFVSEKADLLGDRRVSTGSAVNP